MREHELNELYDAMKIDPFSLERIMRKAESSYRGRRERRSFFVRYAASMAVLIVLFGGILAVTGTVQKPGQAVLVQEELAVWEPCINSVDEEIVLDGQRYYYSFWKSALVVRGVGQEDEASRLLSAGLRDDGYGGFVVEDQVIYFTRRIENRMQLMQLDTETQRLKVLDTRRASNDEEWAYGSDGTECSLKGKLGGYLIYSVENEKHSVLYAYHLESGTAARLAEDASGLIWGIGSWLVTAGELGGVNRTEGPLYLHDLATGESQVLSETCSGAILKKDVVCYLEWSGEKERTCTLICRSLTSGKETLRRALTSEWTGMEDVYWRQNNNCLVSGGGIGTTLLLLPTGVIVEYPEDFVCFRLGGDSYFAVTETAIYRLNTKQGTQEKIMDLTTGESPWGYEFTLRDDRVYLHYLSTETMDETGSASTNVISWSAKEFGIY